jgi:hypothetical protein
MESADQELVAERSGDVGEARDVERFDAIDAE